MSTNLSCVAIGLRQGRAWSSKFDLGQFHKFEVRLSGLFMWGAALESRPAALRLEGMRLAVNLPSMALAPMSSWGGAVLLVYTLLSANAVYCARGQFTRLAGS